MRFATIKSGSKDGALLLVDSSLENGSLVPNSLSTSLIFALENWQTIEPKLKELENSLKTKNAFEQKLKNSNFRSPLPRSYGFLDGSAYLSHVRRVRKSRGAEMPPEFIEIPLMYQGVSDTFLDPFSDIPVIDEAFGVDFEAEIAVVVDEVPMGTNAKDALSHIKLLLLLNDISLRNLIPEELARGFGFLQSKPASSFAPFAVTPDELGKAWNDGKADIQVKVTLNGKIVGELQTGEMHFSFPKLIEHAARTRTLSPGTIIGSGTVSNEDEGRGIGCLVEKRVIEIIASGKAKTEYLKIGDKVTIEAFSEGKSIFGAIQQNCVAF